MSIATDKARIENAVYDIKSAVSAKGVNVPSGTKIDLLAGLISSIPTGVQLSAGECLSCDGLSVTFSGVSGKSNYFLGLDTAEELSGRFLLWCYYSGNSAVSGEVNFDDSNAYQSQTTITKTESGSNVVFSIGDTDLGAFAYGGTYKCWAW